MVNVASSILDETPFQALDMQVYSDPGWEATDDVDGDVSDAVSALGLGFVNAAVSSMSPTAAGTPLPVRYTVSDAAGNTAEGLRLVHIVCSEDQEACTNLEGALACPVEGICNVNAAPPAAVEPAIVTLVGPEVVLVPQGQPYLSCGPSTPLSLTCDQVRLVRQATAQCCCDGEVLNSIASCFVGSTCLTFARAWKVGKG